MSAPQWGLGCRFTRSHACRSSSTGSLPPPIGPKFRHTFGVVTNAAKSCVFCTCSRSALRLSARAGEANGRLPTVARHRWHHVFGRNPELADRVLSEVARRRGQHVAQLDGSEDSIRTNATSVRSWTPRRAVAAAAAVLICSLASGVLGYSLGRQSPPGNQPGDARGAGPVYFVDTQGAGRATGRRNTPGTKKPMRRSGNPARRGTLRRTDSRWDQPIDAQAAGWRNR